MTDRLSRRQYIAAAGLGAAGLAGCPGLGNNEEKSTPDDRERDKERINEIGQDVADNLEGSIEETLSDTGDHLTADNIQNISKRSANRVDQEEGYGTDLWIDIDTNLNFNLLSDNGGNLNDAFRADYGAGFAALTGRAVQEARTLYEENGLMDTAKDFPELDDVYLNLRGTGDMYSRGSFNPEDYTEENITVTVDEVMEEYSVGVREN